MAQQFYKIDLDTTFPMLSEQQTRTVIGATAGEAPAKDEKPGIAYCHNVMPTKYGVESVGYLGVVDAFASLPVGRTFSDVRVVYGDLKGRLYLAWDDEGNVYALLGGATVWIAIAPTVPSTGGSGFSNDEVTIGTVNGVSYIFYAGIGAFNYNETTDALDAVTLTGLTIGDILGVVASSGYLIAYTSLAVAWSSTLDPTDFVPSQVTGAGGGNVSGIAGAIIFCTANSLGFLVYTQANTVASTYTGNVQFPFKFREVRDSKGGINLDRIAYEANSARQFVYSKAGLQGVTSQKAETILPEVTDFLAGRRFEDFNTSTGLYEITDLNSSQTMLKKIKYIASRYLVVSYGITAFTHAIVFDTALNRIGKLKTTHVDVFEYVADQTEIAKESIAFVMADGEVQVVNFSVTDLTAAGVVILGKLQQVRTKFIDLLGVEVENVQTASALAVSDQVSLNGKTFETVVGVIENTKPDLRSYYFRTSGKNHSIVLTGKFNAVTVQIRYAVTSRR